MSSQPLDVFRQLTNGVYVIGVAHGERRNGFTAAWLTQVSFAPLLVALSVNPAHASYPILTASKAFAISILAADRLDLARHFGTQSGREIDKLATQPWSPSPGGFPVLSEAIGHLDCTVTAQHVAGDHILVVAAVVGGGLIRAQTPPLEYRATGDLDGSSALYPPTFQAAGRLASR